MNKKNIKIFTLLIILFIGTFCFSPRVHAITLASIYPKQSPDAAKIQNIIDN